MRLDIIRHAESVGNTLGFAERTALDIPNHDFPLTEKGVTQAREAGKLLRVRHGEHAFPEFDKAFVSPMLRTRQTFENMSLNVPFVIDPRLTEWWKGTWHANQRDEMHDAYPLEAETAEKYGWYFHRPPGGESFLDAHIRVIGFLESLKPWTSEKNYLLVTHGRLFKALQMALGFITDPSEVFSEEGLKEVPNCSIWSFAFDEVRDRWGSVGVIA